jgi:hypothetical protein
MAVKADGNGSGVSCPGAGAGPILNAARSISVEMS